MLENKGHSSEPFSNFNLYEHYKVDEHPYIVALNFNDSDWVEAGRIAPRPFIENEDQTFIYSEVYNFCVGLIQGSILKIKNRKFF